MKSIRVNILFFLKLLISFREGCIWWASTRSLIFGWRLMSFSNKSLALPASGWSSAYNCICIAKTSFRLCMNFGKQVQMTETLHKGELSNSIYSTLLQQSLIILLLKNAFASGSIVIWMSSSCSWESVSEFVIYTTLILHIVKSLHLLETAQLSCIIVQVFASDHI